MCAVNLRTQLIDGPAVADAVPVWEQGPWPRPHPVLDLRDLNWQLHYATACPDALRSSCRPRRSLGR